MQFAEDAKLCVFGSHISKSGRCSVMILNSKDDVKIIAETDFREFGTVACLNGELFRLRLATIKLSIYVRPLFKSTDKNEEAKKDIGWYMM